MNQIYFSTLLFIMCFVSCQQKTVDDNQKSQVTESAITKPKENTDSSADLMNHETVIDDETMLLGKINRDGFDLAEYKNWFDSTYQAYTINNEVIDQIKEINSDVQFKVFLGTWCSDSQREIPALYRIADAIKLDASAMSLIAVDRSKTMPESELKGYDIEYVPTILVMKNQEEIGRIVEYPEVTLEEDILKFIKP